MSPLDIGGTEQDDNASITVKFKYECERGTWGLSNYKREVETKKDQKCIIVVLQHEDMITLQFYRIARHNTILTYKFDHLNGTLINVGFDKFEMTLGESMLRCKKIKELS